MSVQPAAICEQNRATNQGPESEALNSTETREVVIHSGHRENLHGVPFKTDIHPSELITVKDGTLNVYVILVHGIIDRERKNQKRWETWQPWLESMGLWGDNTIQDYNYDVQTSNPEIFTKCGIETEAARLVESLIQHKQSQPPRETLNDVVGMSSPTGLYQEEQDSFNNRYVFVALAIGGILVKKVVRAAASTKH
ncbi:uncharacterized protein DSM5745_08608 [Aspergillus mulundensis]|uniref:Uncharacterized protein n=1 Tax=Aspergillus mulundensis TaxID=1810919 RepID=A0A3D8R4F8_9EURO|nr:hypothetical protein DSM5745_08608 [Aspergillus mulundensis]RDW68848.1 hypothetical protein DSM5745_08608 [Aspergillus mulundensis]